MVKVPEWGPFYSEVSMKFFASLVTALLLTSTSAMAGEVRKARSPALGLGHKVKKTTVRSDLTCANFSGTWEGTCTQRDSASGDANEWREERVIEQDGCSMVSTTESGDTFEVYPGVIRSQSDSDMKFYDGPTESPFFAMHFSADWSSDRTALVSEGFFSSLGLARSVPESPAAFKGRLSLNRDQLIDTYSIDTMRVVCRLSRVR